MNSYLTAVHTRDPAFLNQVELFRARTDLAIAAHLIKVGLSESENLRRLLLEAETVLARLGYLAQAQDAHPQSEIPESMGRDA
ncbi:MAG TPA: hypothetical protein VMT62_09485 [Syntrophorhabdaceae bacterium]|nr:hypothetical protein [Syntrophorhabdaceae bacterium]